MKLNRWFLVTFRGTEFKGIAPKQHTFATRILAESSAEAIDMAMEIVDKAPAMKEMYNPSYTAKCLDN